MDDNMEKVKAIYFIGKDFEFMILKIPKGPEM
jgi:hypothetical protein